MQLLVVAVSTVNGCGQDFAKVGQVVRVSGFLGCFWWVGGFGGASLFAIVNGLGVDVVFLGFAFGKEKGCA